MPRVKICGITSYEDAIQAIESGADALGFIFYAKSPRYISPLNAATIIKKLPPFIEKVGLFVNEDAKSINTKAKQAHITLIQLHFETNKSLQNALHLPFIEVIRAAKAEDITTLDQERYYLIDAYCESYGGSGKRINIEWFQNRDNSKTILAGGLTPDNLTELKSYNFYAYDVSSGTEASPGKKSFAKVAKFIEEAHK